MKDDEPYFDPSKSRNGRTALHIACAHTDNHRVRQAGFHFVCYGSLELSVTQKTKSMLLKLVSRLHDIPEDKFGNVQIW